MTRDEQTDEALASSAQTSGGSALRTGCLWMFGLLLVFSLYAAGIILLGDSLEGVRLWRERPHVTVDARLVDVESWTDSNSSSGYVYRGTYYWTHQGSEGTFRREKKYEDIDPVPDHVDITLYCGTDDAWHPLGENGGGLFDFVLNLVSGCLVMLAAALVAFLTLRSIAKKILGTLRGSNVLQE